MAYWKVVPCLLEDDEIWQQWSHLAEQYHDNNPMLHSLFVKGLLAFFPEKIYCARLYDENPAINGLDSGDNAALEEPKLIMLLQYLGNGKWRTYKPSQAQTALLVMASDTVISWQGLFAALPHLALYLDVYALDSRDHAELISSLPAHITSHAATNMTIDVEGDFEDYWSARPKSLKSNIRRYLKRLERDNLKLSIESLDQDEALKFGVDQYGMLESQGWKGRAQTALHPGNVQGAFYRELLSSFGKDGQALVFELRLGETLVASRLCVFNQHIFIMLKTTFDEDFRRHAVGRILLYFVIKHVFDNKLTKTIDFYTNATRDQLDWSSNRREMVNATLYRYKWLDFGVAKVKSLRARLA